MNKLILAALIYLIEGQPAHQVKSLELRHFLGQEDPDLCKTVLLCKLELMLEKAMKED